MSPLRLLVRGMVAGAVGTAAMTVSELLEMSISGREASTVPGQVGAHLVPGREGTSDEDATLYRALGVADVPWRWPAAELASDLGHKAVYAAVTGLTYDALTARAGSSSGHVHS